MTEGAARARFLCILPNSPEAAETQGAVCGIVAALFDIVNAAGNVAIIAMPGARDSATTWNQTTMEADNPDPTRTEKRFSAISAWRRAPTVATCMADLETRRRRR
jgi:hypothetical protein